MSKYFDWFLLAVVLALFMVIMTSESHCQKLPDSPSTIQILRSKSFLLTVGGDFLITSYDAEMTHAGIAHHKCVEHNIHPPYPSRGDMYRTTLPENAGIAVVSFLWLKFKGPKWIMPGFLAAPAYFHVSAANSWVGSCW